ncbi:hypothetical protein AAG906_011160 [Vitis piasezkii]
MSEGVQILEVIVWVEAIPRAWFGRFTKSMRAFGYRQSNSDHTLFLKKQHGKITTLIVYVDDMVVTRNDPEERKALQNYLSREFEMKDLGPLKYFLGIEVDDRRSTSGYFTFVGYLSRQPIRSFCDNKAACDIAHNPIQHDRTKHVEVDRFFIKEKLDDKIVELPKIRSEDQLADILTKAVSSQVFSKFLDKLGMCDIYAPT